MSKPTKSPSIWRSFSPSGTSSKTQPKRPPEFHSPIRDCNSSLSSNERKSCSKLWKFCRDRSAVAFCRIASWRALAWSPLSSPFRDINVESQSDSQAWPRLSVSVARGFRPVGTPARIWLYAPPMALIAISKPLSLSKKNTRAFMRCACATKKAVVSVLPVPMVPKTRVWPAVGSFLGSPRRWKLNL